MVDINGRCFLGVISIFFESKFKDGNFFVRDSVEYRWYYVFDEFWFLVIVDGNNLFLVVSYFEEVIVFVDVY